MSRRLTWSPKKCGEAGTTVTFDGFGTIQSTPGKWKPPTPRVSWQPVQLTSLSRRSKPRTHGDVERCGPHPVDPRKVEAAAAAGLVAAGTADVVEPAFKTRDRADVVQ